MNIRSYLLTATGFVAAGTLALVSTSCDWSGGSSDDFNTSGGSTSVNISGFYSGVQNSGLAVSRTSGGAITSLTVQQSGNTLNVTDSNGQNYKGNVGSPLTLASPDDLGLIPTGAQLASFQVSWAGTDGVAQRDVSFSGVISVVSINSIQGESEVTTRTEDSAENNSSDTVNVNTTDVTNNSDNSQVASNTQNIDTINQNTSNSTNGDSFNAQTTVTIDGLDQAQQVGGDNNGNTTIEGQNTTTTRSTTSARNNANTNTSLNDVNATGNRNTVNSTNAQQINNNNNNTVATTNATNSRGSTVNVTTTTENTFQLTDANTQHRLRGSWVEEGGTVGNVDAVAAGAGGFISTTSTTTN